MKDSTIKVTLIVVVILTIFGLISFNLSSDLIILICIVVPPYTMVGMAIYAHREHLKGIF